MKGKEKLVKRYLPVEVFDMAGLTEWFSSMAAQGLHLVKLSENRAQFRPGPPQPEVRYALDVSTCYDIERERNENYAQMGWDYVTTLHGMYYVYRSSVPSAPDLHTDPVTQGGTLTKLIRRQRRALPLSLVCMAFIMRDQLRTLFTAPWSVPKFVILHTEQALLWLVLMVSWLLLCLLPTLRRVSKLKQLRRQLLDGIPLEEGRRWKRRFHPLVRDYGIFALMAVVLALYCWMTPHLTWRLSHPEDYNFPHVTLEEALDGTDANSFTPETVYDKMPRPDTFRRSLLCPEQYFWSQGGSAQFSDGCRELFTSVGYYRADSSGTAAHLTHILAEDIWKSLVDYRKNQEELSLGAHVVLSDGFQALSYNGLDELYVTEYRTDNEPATRYYLGRKDSRVFRLVVRGLPAPETCLDRLVKHLNDT